MGKWVNCHVYDMNYLMNTELTEDDLHRLFETSSLNTSLILEMFRRISDTRENWEIMKMAKTETDWFNKYEWTQKQKDAFAKDLSKVFMNVYQYGEEIAKTKASWWLIYYGLIIKDNKFKRRKRRKNGNKEKS